MYAELNFNIKIITMCALLIIKTLIILCFLKTCIIIKFYKILHKY